MNSKHSYSNHWQGANYKKISLPQYSINMKYLVQIKFNGTERVLDIGCGNGDTTREIANRIQQGSVLGIDASESMITEASLTQQGKNLTFNVVNVLDMIFEEQFDCITSFFCLQWVPDKLAAFEKIKQALVDDGQFHMIVPMPHPHLPKIREVVSARIQWASYFTDYVDPLIHINDNDYREYAEKAGLTVASDITELEPVYFKNYDEFFSFMYEMTPHLSCLPDENLKQAFLKEILEEYLKIYPIDNQDVCHLDFNLRKFSCHYRLVKR